MLMLYLTMLDEDSDRSNFEYLYRLYDFDIKKRIQGILSNEKDTEDALQETWMQIFKHIRKFRHKSDMAARAYIMRVARNQAISVLRAKQKECAAECDIEEVGDLDDTPLFHLCEQEGVETVLSAIKELSEAQRDVLILYYLHQHSLKEIAALLHISEVAAASRWTRGRQNLIRLLGKERKSCVKKR